jgi:tetratricopeptide (TPR) repeat protein
MGNWNQWFAIEFVQQLLFLDSVQQVRYTLRNTRDLDSTAVISAISSLGEEYQKENKKAQYDLLLFLQKIFDEEFASNSASNSKEESKTSVTTPEELASLVLQTDNLVRIYTLTRDNRHLLSDDVSSQLQYQELKQKSRPSPQGLILLNLIARFMKDQQRVGMAILAWATFCRDNKRYTSALRHLKRVKTLAEGQQDKDLLSLVQSFEAFLLEKMGNYAGAAEIIAGVMDAELKAGKPWLAYRGTYMLADLYRKLGRYTEAVDLLANSEQETKDYDPEYTSRTTNLQGLILEDLQRYEEALTAFQKAVDFARLANDQQLEFVALNNIAANYEKRGNLREALRRFRQIFHLVEKQGNLVRLAASQNNLGHILLDLGQPREAQMQYLSSLAIKSNSGDRIGQAIAAFGAGNAANALGNKQEAETFYNFALVPGLELYKSEGNTSILRDHALHMANLQAVVDDRLAQNLFEHHEIARQQGDIFWESVLLQEIARYLVSKGDRVKAIELFRDCIERAERLDKLSHQVLRSQVKLATILMVEDEAAQEAYHLLGDVLAKIDILMQGALLDEQRSQTIAQWIAAYSAMIKLLVEKDKVLQLSANMPSDELAFNQHEAAKSRTFIASLADAAIRPPEDVPADLQAQEAHLLELERVLQNRGRDEGTEFTHNLERLRQVQQQLQSCWKEMRSYAPEYVRLRSAEPTTLQELRALFGSCPGPKTAFVSFFCDADTTTAFVIRSDEAPLRVFRSPVGQEKLNLVAQRLWRAFNGDADEFPPYPPILREQPEGRSLKFFDELSPDLLKFLPAVEGVELLCIAPHGPMHLLPLHALRAPDGKYLVEHFAVSYTPSASTLNYVFSRGTRFPGPNIPKAYVAGVASRADKHPEYFENDAAIFPAQFWRTQVDSGPRTTTPEHVIHALQDSYDVVHVTCHGYFDTRTPLNSGLILADGKNRPPRIQEDISVLDRKDFLLTAKKMMSTMINAPLVTLRACSSGAQRAHNFGDEFEGLSRALLYAGSAAMLVSMWNVDQQSSQLFLSKFYRRWREFGLTEKWRALWESQKEFILAPEEPYLRHPYHWAPFILIGDWR